jgi:uncharacterized membrane protein
MKGIHMPQSYEQTGLSDNAAAAITYVTIIPAVVFLVLPPYSRSPFVRFHAWQSIFLSITAVVVTLVLALILGFSLAVGSVLFVALTRLIWVFWVLTWILCAINALNGKAFRLPVIGPFAAKLASK